MNQHSREYFKCSTWVGVVERVVQWGRCVVPGVMLFILLFKEMYLKFDNLTT